MLYIQMSMNTVKAMRKVQNFDGIAPKDLGENEKPLELDQETLDDIKTKDVFLNDTSRLYETTTIS